MSAPAANSVVDLLADGVGERERDLARVAVVLGRRPAAAIVNGPGHRDLDQAVGVRAQELDVAHQDAARGGGSGPATRGAGIGLPLRSSTEPGLSTSTPSSAITK